MTKPTITRRYTTALDMPFEDHRPPYSVWDAILSETTVTSRIARFADVDPDEDEDEDEDEAREKQISARKTTVTCADFETALRRFDRRVAARLPRVAEWTEAGYVVRGPKLVPAEGQDAPDAVWVRADALLEEPLGEASARALARFAELARQAPTERTRREACALLATHCDRWVSGLLPYATLRFSGGALDAVELGPDQNYVASTTAAELGAFFDLPIAKTVRRFVLGEVGPVAVSGNPYCDLVPLVRALLARERPSLEELALGVTADGEGHNDVGDLSPLWKQVPNLRSLATGAFVEKLGDVSSSRLRSLRLLHSLHEHDAEPLVYGAFTSLESLELRLGTRATSLAPLWSPAGMPKLTRLDLVMGHDDHVTLPTLVAQLADSTVLRRLDHLSISLRTRRPLDVPLDDALRKHAAAFSRLTSLGLGGFFVTPERAAGLTACLPRLAFSPRTAP